MYTDVVCPFCGCLCDDLEITVEGNEVTGTKGTCAISRSKFMSHAENKIEAPTVGGKKATTRHTPTIGLRSIHRHPTTRTAVQKTNLSDTASPSRG